MGKRHISRDNGNEKSRRQKRLAGWLCAFLVVVAVIALAKWSGTPAARPTQRHDSQSKPTGLADAGEDQALRREQIKAAESLLTEFPTNDDAVYLAGLIHEDQGDTEQAMKLWARSIELDATRADANESLGHALLLRDDYTAAEKYLRRALALDSNSPSARLRLATVLSHDGRMADALEVLEQGRAVSAEGYRLLGEICHELKRYERARTNYEMAVRLKPEFPEAYYGLAQTLAQLGESEQSRAAMERSSALRRESDERARQVRADFDSLLVTRKSVARTHTDMGRVYVVLGRPQKAEELWRRAAALDAQNVLCRLQLAVLYQQMKRDGEALRFYEEAAQLDPKDALTQLNLGRVCLRLNQSERAERTFREVIRLEPKRPEGYSALAQLYLQTRSNLAEAERLAGVAAELAPEAPYFALLSQACAQHGNQSGAVSAINRAIELQPGNSQFVQMREAILASKR
jgi:protein O-mannosyl-transferase